MNFTDYLTALTTTTLNLTSSLSYGYGDLATKEINSLKDLLSKAEKMIPVIETEACMAEVEELDREERSFNYWMTMLYGNEDVISSMDSHNSSKANRLKRRKQNKKHHKADRYHGKCFEGREDGKRIYKDRYCRFPISDRVRNHSALKAEAREQEYLFSKQETEEPVKEIKSEESKVEGVGLEDFLWYLIDRLSEQKYIVLYNYDNGRDWEDHEYDTNRFLGVMTKDKIIAELTERFLHNATGVDVSDTVNEGLKGIEFNWDFGCDEWGWWAGYESYTIILVSEI